MRSASCSYPGQFDQIPDHLHVAIPRHEIIREMARRGELPALSDACLAVAVVAELLIPAEAGQ